MKNNTICFIVDFDEFTRQACIEALHEHSFSTITIEEKGKRITKPAWATTIGLARTIRNLGQEQCKTMSFRIVIARTNGTLRYAKSSEWIISRQKRRSIERTVSTQIAKLKAKRMVRARVGIIS